MSVIRKRHFSAKIGVVPVLGILFLCFLSGMSHGQDADRNVPDHYPDTFEAIGTIDRITNDEIVIGDTLYRLSPSVTYHTPTIEDASKHLFSVGSLVGFLINNKREVTSLWLID